MTAQPQTQPLPGAMPAAPPIARETIGSKGASRNARIALGLSLLVATAGVSFAIGHATAPEATGTSATPFATGTVPFSAGIAEAAADADIAAVDAALPGGAEPAGGATGSGLAAATAADVDSETEGDVSSIEVVDATQAEPVGPPDSGAGSGGRPGLGGAPGGAAGTVAEISDAALTITTADGTEQTFVIDDSTSWVQQETIDAAMVQPGDRVTVELPMAGPGASEPDSSIATQVVVSGGA